MLGSKIVLRRLNSRIYFVVWLTLQLELALSSYISRSGTWGLGPRFRRKLTETEETQFQDLLVSFNRIYLPIEVSDGGSWKPSTDGDFSVASFCIALSGDLHTPSVPLQWLVNGNSVSLMFCSVAGLHIMVVF